MCCLRKRGFTKLGGFRTLSQYSYWREKTDKKAKVGKSNIGWWGGGPWFRNLFAPCRGQNLTRNRRESGKNWGCSNDFSLLPNFLLQHYMRYKSWSRIVTTKRPFLGRVYILLGGGPTTPEGYYFCKSIAIEMGGVSRYFSKYRGQGSMRLS